MEIINTTVNSITVAIPDLGLRIAPGGSIEVSLEQVSHSSDFTVVLSKKLLGVRFTPDEVSRYPLIANRIKSTDAFSRPDVGTRPDIGISRPDVIRDESHPIRVREEKVIQPRTLKVEVTSPVIVSSPIEVSVEKQDEISKLLEKILLQAVFVYVGDEDGST